MRRVRTLLVKELIQIRRDPRLFALLVAAPALQILVLGFAATTDVRDVAVAVRDGDRSAHSREYARTLGASGWLRTSPHAGGERDDARLLISGRAGLVLAIPPGFGAELAAGRPVTVQALADGSDSLSAVQGLAYLQGASRLYSERQVRVALDRRPGGSPGIPSIAIETRTWFNPMQTSRLYIVSGLLGVLLLVTTMVVAAMAFVKEREEGTMEQMLVTPLRRGELVVGKLLPFVVIGFLEVTVVLPVVLFVFGLPLRGSLALLYAFSGLFLLTTLGLGLLVSSLVRTQQQAMLVAVFFLMMPFVMLSGFIFPVENMPAAIRTAAEAIPLRHYLIAIRGIFLKGSGVAELWDEGLILLCMGGAILTLAVLSFRKRLD
jgi:ABC-2 type transport system permease protein